MVFFKQLIVLSIIFLGSNLNAMEELIFHVVSDNHVMALSQDAHAIVSSDLLHQTDSGFTIISGEFDTSNWERSTPRESTYINNEHQDNLAQATEHANKYDNTNSQDAYKTENSKQYFVQTDVSLQVNAIVHTSLIEAIDKLANNVKSPTYRANLIGKIISLKKEQQKQSIRDYLFSNVEKQIDFLDALLDGTIDQMIATIQKGDLNEAKKAFDQLKKMWPWDHKKSFLIDHHTSGPSEFIEFIRGDIMQLAEGSLVSRKDYLESYDKSFTDKLTRYQKLILSKQLQGDISFLQKEAYILSSRLFNNPKSNSCPLEKAMLVTLNAVLANPITKIFSTIKNANFDISTKTLGNFQMQCLWHFEGETYKTMKEASADMIKRHGVDLLAMANKCYKSHSDYQEKIAQQKSNAPQDNSAKTIQTKNSIVNAKSNIKPTYAYNNIIDFENDTMKLHKIPIQDNSTCASSVTTNNSEKYPNQNPISKLATIGSQYITGLNNNNYLNQNPKKNAGNSNDYSYAYAGIPSFTRVNTNNSHNTHNICDNKMYASGFDKSTFTPMATLVATKVQGDGNKHSNHTSNNGGINSALHYDSKNSENRKEANHAVSSEFKTMQMNGDKKGLEIKKEQLKEELKNTWLPWKASSIHAQIAEIDMLLKSPLTETLAIIKDADLYTALYELNRLEGLARQEELSYDPIFCVKQSEYDINSLSNIYYAAQTIFYARPDAPKISTYHPTPLENNLTNQKNNTNKSTKDAPLQKPINNTTVANDQNITLNNEQDITPVDSLNMVSTAISQDTLTITPEANQRITETLDTLNDQSLEAVSSHIDTLVAILQEQKLDPQANGKCFAEGLRLYALLRQYIENPNKRIVAQPDANVLIFNARKNALDVVAHNPTACQEQSFTLTPEACDLLQTYGLNPEQFMYCVGNEVQHQLYSEFVKLLNAIAEIESNVSTQPMIDMVLTCTEIGRIYTEQNNLGKAFSLADCAWAALDCAKVICDSGINIVITKTPEVAEGIVEGCINAVYNTANMVLDPVGTLSNIGAALGHFTLCLMDIASLTEDDFLAFNLDSSKYIEENAQKRREKIEAIVDAVNQTTLKGGTAFVTEQIISCLIMDFGIDVIKHCAKSSAIPLAKLGKAITDKVPNKIPKAFSAIRQEITDTLSNFTKAEHVAVTADGTKVTVTASEEASTFNAMSKQHGNNHNKKPTFNDIKNEVSKDAKVQESVLRKKMIKPGPHGIYKEAPYHTINSKGIKSRCPIDGQHALDNSFSIGDTTSRRVSLSKGEFVVLDQTRVGEFHGHVREWLDLEDMQGVLIKAGLVTKSGKIR